MVAAGGLQPRLLEVPVIEMVGGIRSSTHVINLVALEKLLQSSVAVHDLVCDRVHPEICIGLVATVSSTFPQLLVTVANPSAVSISAAVGLQPGSGPIVRLIKGLELFTIHVTIRETDAVLPHASEAIHVLFWE